MNPADLLPLLLGLAVLLPLASFALIFVAGPRMGKAGEHAGHVATAAILGGLLLSLVSLGIWVTHHRPPAAGHGHKAPAPREADHHGMPQAADHADAAGEPGAHDPPAQAAGHSPRAAEAAHGHAAAAVVGYTGNWYTLGTFGRLQLSIGYYIDALTVCMFCMVTLIATCIHFYALGYMHDELHDVTDHEVTLADGSHLHRPGRFPRFFQYMSLFCFSMLGLVVAGNIAMTFVFWELVGICSYFLIGFYVERQSASTAANKAFIVNRIGDFGMIIGLMALWSSLGTFNFGEIDGQPGIFRQVRSPEHGHALRTPDGMVRLAAAERVAEVVGSLPRDAAPAVLEAAVAERVEQWRGNTRSGGRGGYGYGLLIVAGIGIFCGCVGKSAQFPLHTWLPDAMEGPTPVSALVHSATMVAAGVFLVGRFYPVFAPEVLLVIAVTGCITLFLAATIAITATDIKRVLAYSTVSQLGYMMMALGVGGWLAGMLHLFTHAFFKSLLFLCSGSVIHAVHTNEMPLMGGLRRKMPWTAYTMLVGCLAIAGAGIPFVIGLSGYYSKDAILEQALSFSNGNAPWGPFFFYTAAGGAAITAFYMFRLWYLTFAGSPRDHHRYDHAHESPPVMYVPLVVLAILAIGVAWTPREGVLGAVLGAVVVLALMGRWRLRAASVHDPHEVAPRGRLVPLMLCGLVLLVALAWWPAEDVVLASLLEQARPAGTLAGQRGVLVNMTWPNEHDSHAAAIKVPATLIAFGTAAAGFLLATAFYGLRLVDAEDARRQFRPIYNFLLHKWWFDELYDLLFVRPVLAVSRLTAALDRRWIDGLIDGLARTVRHFAELWDRIADRTIVDGLVNQFAAGLYRLGLSLREVQTGRLRQYVLFIVLGTVAAFILASFIWSYSLAR